MPHAVEMTGISKYFPSSNVQANRGVNFRVQKAEIHALVGENGAGKTTLMNILYGLYEPDEGKILLDGQEVILRHPQDAIRCGVDMVHQHFKLVPSFSVAENILLGAEPGQAGFLRPAMENEVVRRLADSFGLPVDPQARVRDLPVGMQQRVEILKALQRDAQILLLDEPTAVLTPQETRELFDVIRNLAQRGRTIVFITHKLPEVMEIADQVTVMRRGEVVANNLVSETSIPELARQMVGREVLFRVVKKPAAPGSIVAAVKNLVVAGAGCYPAVKGVSFHVRAGEILGIAGVNGNGQEELVEAVTGMRPTEMGAVYLESHDITHLPVGERRAKGLAHIPEDRMSTGLNLKTTLDENIISTRYRLPEFSRRGFLLWANIRQFAEKIIKDLSVAAAHPGEGIDTLSGGNLQKIVIGRELSGDPRFIVADQPTRGLDVGSIEFVHKTLIEARDRGAAILLVSVELDEIRSLSDRILVMYRGRIAGELSANDATEESLGILMAGGKLAQVEKEA